MYGFLVDNLLEWHIVVFAVLSIIQLMKADKFNIFDYFTLSGWEIMLFFMFLEKMGIRLIYEDYHNR